ncbi:MAG: nucleotidyltransferase domain-containing protein [Nanoarchaeota archaeon]
MRELLIISYVYDFLSMVFEEDKLKDSISEVILFGSVAKNEYDNESDIDIFFNIKEEKETKKIEESLKKIQKSFEIKASKTWELKNIKFPISIMVGALEDETWKDLREEIISSGIVLYGRYKVLPENLNHYFIISYSLNGLSNKKKMKAIRQLYGYRIKKAKKIYEQPGILSSYKGKKLSSNVILIPGESLKEAKKFLQSHKIPYKIYESWIRV